METTGAAILELGLLLLLAALAGKLSRLLGLPAVVGYLVVGVAVSPFTPGYVADHQQLTLLADLGVVLLLFEVGIEVDPLLLLRERRSLLAAAPLQLLATSAVATVAFAVLGVAPLGAALLGLSMALSSSVVVVNITRSRSRTTDAATDEALLGWSVLQDLVGVAAALVLLVAAGLGGRSTGAAVAGLLGFVAVSAAAAVALPWLLRRLRSEHDLFLMVSVAAGLFLAGLGSRLFGVPLALAAFVAGLAITESPASAEARRRILPFRDVFAVMFFMALGSVIDPRALPAALPWLVLMLGVVIAGKVGAAWLLAVLLRLPVRRLQLAVGLGQIGEFSYVLVGLGVAAGLIAPVLRDALVAAVALTVAGSSVLVRFAVPRRA